MDSQQETKLMPVAEALGDYLEALLDENPKVNEQEESITVPMPSELEQELKSIADNASVSKNDEVASSPVANWNQSEFPAVLVKLEKLTLALPLCTVQKIIELKEDVIQKASDDGVIGHYIETKEPIKVLDATQVILGKITDNSKGYKGKSLIVSTDGNSSILVDTVISESQLTNSDVKLRNNPVNRLWLLGTLTKQTAALIDIRTLEKV